MMDVNGNMGQTTKFVFSMRNFRSVAAGDIEIKPVTVLTGANGSGKSSFMYGLMALKNLLLNANQPADNFFNFGFLNLGGVKEVVTGKDIERTVEFRCQYCSDLIETTYVARLGQISSLQLVTRGAVNIDLRLEVSFPYPLNKRVEQGISWENRLYKLNFNGRVLTLAPLESSARVPDDIFAAMGRPMLKATWPLNCDYIDVKRGFFKNLYAPVPPGVSQTLEEEAAALLANDRDLEAKVSVTLEKMFNKSFAARHASPGEAFFYLQTVDKETGFACDLVNEGFGINQLVYLLAKLFRKDSKFLCVEEPETHLHPEALAKLAEQMVVAAKRDDKRFLIASHSEHFVVSLLNLIAQGEASQDDIGIYFVAKDDNGFTKLSEQKVNEKGQIEGGLRSFYEPSIRALEEFLGPEPDPANANPAK